MTLLVAVCCALATTFAGAAGEETVSSMYGTFWALVPPIIAIALALITKEVYSSLFIGIVAGAFFYAGGHPVAAFDTIMNSGLLGGLADVWTVGIMIFLVILELLWHWSIRLAVPQHLADGHRSISRRALAPCLRPLHWVF